MGKEGNEVEPLVRRKRGRLRRTRIVEVNEALERRVLDENAWERSEWRKRQL